MNNIDDDEMNSMLDKEFHTKNGIPTNPRSHNLFFISRGRAFINWICGVGGGVMCGYVTSSSHGNGSNSKILLFLLGVCLCLVLSIPGGGVKDR